MLVIQHTDKYGNKKAYHLNAFHTIEISETDKNGVASLIIHREYVKDCLDYSSKEKAEEAFDLLMEAIKEQKPLWVAPTSDAVRH